MSTITCPSGLSGDIRHLRGAELEILSDQSAIASGAAFDRILDACWQSTSDPGPYQLAQGGRPRWAEILTCDRFYTLLMIRVATHGSVYEFQVPCGGKCRRKKFWWDLPLDQLPVKALPAESVEAFKSGNEFSVDIDGATVTYKLTVGADERAAMSLVQESPTIIDMLVPRIIRIQQADKVIARPKDVAAFLKDCRAADLTTMFDAFEAVDGGIDTALEVICPRCREYMDVSLPFDAGFFLPRSRNRASARR
jgi:hypothetical protein